MLLRLTAAVLGLSTLALTHRPVSAEFLMQERDGVLYVKNIEPPPSTVTTKARVGAPAPPDAYRGLIREVAERHALAPALVESVIRVESNFEARAVSPKGASGLMQLMPATAARLGVRNIFDVRENVEAGVRHLRGLMDLYRGNIALTLAAYNAGVDAVARYRGIPPYAETQAYVARILRLLEDPGAAPAASVREGAPASARALYRYETSDGQIVFTNVPADRLSPSTRDLLEGTSTR